MDPRDAHKPLVGPLQGLYRITYGRYRAIYSADAGQTAHGDVVVHVTVRIIAVGIRKEGDRKDVYRLAQKLVAMGLIDVTEADADADANADAE